MDTARNDRLLDRDLRLKPLKTKPAPREISLAAPFSYHAASLRITSAAPFLYTVMHTISSCGSRTSQ
jgi:hypothetical protein